MGTSVYPSTGRIIRNSSFLTTPLSYFYTRLKTAYPVYGHKPAVEGSGPSIFVRDTVHQKAIP